MNVHELFVYLCVSDVQGAIDFYSRAFGAREKLRLTEPGGRVGHAEIEIGDQVVMLAEPFPEMNVVPPDPTAGDPVAIHLHLDDADATLAAAKEAGATVLAECQDQFYGERSGRLRDPYGHVWLLGHSIEEVAPEEMQRRYDALFGG